MPETKKHKALASKHFILSLLACFIAVSFFVSPSFANNGFKEGGKKIGEGVKEIGKETGQAFKEGGKKVGQGFKDLGKETAKESKKAGRTAGEWFRDIGIKTGEAFRNMGKSFKEFFTGKRD